MREQIGAIAALGGMVQYTAALPLHLLPLVSPQCGTASHGPRFSVRLYQRVSQTSLKSFVSNE